MPSASTPKNAPKRSKKKFSPQTPVMPRGQMGGFDEDDVLMSGGSHVGAIYGRCGGRILGSQLEQEVCDLLSRAGITHSHSPRHFEIRLNDETVAAYAPRIVLRGRGREGKSVVIETATDIAETPLEKISAFRQQYGSEFYFCFIAPEEVLDEIPISAYDEASSTVDMHTLISRLAD